MTNKLDNIYRVNIKRLALLTLPTWLRRPLVGALLYAGVTPLAMMLAELRRFRTETTYRITHNGQVCKLRAMLNDEFDPELRRIKIDETGEPASQEASAAWQRDVGRWIMVPQRNAGAKSIHREGFGGTSGYDFWVIIPEDLHTKEIEVRLKAMVNMYKLASKRYALNYK